MFEKLSERYTKLFERPAPVVSCDKEIIEASSPPGFYDGYFIIKNEGGGNLEGDIFAGSSFITLSNQLIEGNDVIIEFEMDLRHMSPGEVFTSRIIVTTSGGQLIIPVKINIKQHGVKCGRFRIHTLKDYEGCVRAIPAEAVALFVTPEFEKWLVQSKCEHIEFYRILSCGVVGIKEIDSFLSVCAAKEKAAIKLKKDKIDVRIPFGEDKKSDTVPLACATWGTFLYDVKTLGNSPWLTLSKDKITNADFTDGEYQFAFNVSADEIKGARQSETILFETGGQKLSAVITAHKPKPFLVTLSRLSYKSEDSGYLIVENHTGRNAMLEVAAIESFVRFKAAKYLISERAEIPFEIKVNSFLNLGIGRKPVNVSDVICRTVVDGKVYKQTLTVKAGSLLNG